MHLVGQQLLRNLCQRIGGGNNMDSKIMIIFTDFVILETYDPEENLYEYYVKYGTNDFEYKFGSFDRFSELQLKALIEHGYFD